MFQQNVQYLSNKPSLPLPTLNKLYTDKKRARFHLDCPILSSSPCNPILGSNGIRDHVPTTRSIAKSAYTRGIYLLSVNSDVVCSLVFPGWNSNKFDSSHTFSCRPHWNDGARSVWLLWISNGAIYSINPGCRRNCF